VTLGTVMDAEGRTAEATDCYVQPVRLYRAAAGFEPHPLGGIARRLYDELVAMPELRNGRLDHPRIKALRERLDALH